MHIGRDACEGQKVSNSPELEIQVVVGCLMWILGIKFRYCVVFVYSQHMTNCSYHPRIFIISQERRSVL